MSERALVLVVEDEQAIADAVAARLRNEGLLVEVAGDGPSGVARCEELRPDLVILDLMLPGFDGLEVCRRIQRRRPPSGFLRWNRSTAAAEAALQRAC